MRYGWCPGCERWVPRDEMLSFNTDVYDAENRREVVRQRYCPVCADEERVRLEQRRWKDLLVRAEALELLPDGSFPSRELIWERECRFREEQNRTYIGETEQDIRRCDW